MNRRLWVGALGLCLSGGLGLLTAQEPVWRAAQRPQPAPVVRGVSAAPGAWLDRPVGAARGSSAEPRPFPAVYQAARPLHTSQMLRGVEPIATVPPPGAVIATSGTSRILNPLPSEDLTDPMHVDQFAQDRGGVPAVQASVVTKLPLPPVLPEGDWRKTIPTDMPSPATVLKSNPVYGEPLILEEAPPTQFYVKGEYLLWWMKPDKAPPLVTTGNPKIDPQPGKLGQASTIILMDGNLDRSSFSGFRGAVGLFLDDCGSTAIELSGFYLGQRSTRFAADSSRYPVLTRPFFNVSTGREDVEVIANPDLGVTGSVRIEAPSQLWGAEVNALCNWCCGCDWRVDAIAGVRVLGLRESLTITEMIQNPATDPAPFNGTMVTVQDRFATNNIFYGGQVGVEGRWQRGRFTVDGRGKLAIGITKQQLEISGFQQFTPPTTNISPLPGGLYALDSNIGNYSRGRFSVVPEVGVTLGYFLTDYIRATAGYNFLYWSGVARPGEQIDRNIDETRIPNFRTQNDITPQKYPVPAPAVTFPESDFWAHGLTFGLEFRY
ncbi:MAG: BBP7 family outer membrane beta-barrel protein [Gemmataceae bacterium]